MMRQNRREGSPIATDLPMTLTTKRQSEMKSLSDSNSKSKNGSPTTPPRSPISKAFDFFPWARNKKHTEKTEKTVKKEDSHHFHKSLFKNALTTREILADKSNKTKPITKTDPILQRHNTLSGYNRKNRKMTRNKSLDTDELILKAEEHFDNSELSKSWNDRGSFLSDTLMNDDQKYGCENISPKNIHSSKHIIFNDENVVYLIRKEKPVHAKDDNAKEKSRIFQKQKTVEENNNSSYPDGNVIKARLKLAKFGTQQDNPTTVQNPNALNKPPGILYRQASFDKQLSVEAAPPAARRSPEPSSEGSNGSRDKPRKKLSFREPVVSQKRTEIQQSLQILQQNRNSYPNNSPQTYDSQLESQAMLIVRTVGQAFEVCHNCPDESSDVIDHDIASEQFSEDEVQKKDAQPGTPDMSLLQRPNQLEIIVPPVTNNSNFRKSPGSDGDRSPPSPVSSSKEIQQLKDLLEQQALQTRQTVAQLTLVKEQLISETKARIEAQVRTKHLLQQNRELLEQLVSLGGYTEPNQTGLTSANIALAPQSPLQMFLQDQPEMSSPIRKAFLPTSNNNNLPSISQHLNNLGSVNQQLNTLTHQLSGLNQQSQNLQNLQNYNQSLQNLSLQASGTFPAMNQMQNMNNNLTNQTGQDVITQNELYQMNQELLNRLQNLNLNMNNSPVANNNTGTGQNMNNNNSPHNSYIFANPGHISNSPGNNNNNNFNFLSSPNSMGNMTPSPLGTLNRNSYINSPLEDNLGLSIDTNLNNIDDTASHFIKPLSQVGTLTTIDPDGKVKVIVPVSNGDGRDNSATSSSYNRRLMNVPNNVVTLKVTDEAGNVTNTRKLSATPSFITRSTSEKVPNRSQMMSEVQRTAWARHTTK